MIKHLLSDNTLEQSTMQLNNVALIKQLLEHGYGDLLIKIRGGEMTEIAPTLFIKPPAQLTYNVQEGKYKE